MTEDQLRRAEALCQGWRPPWQAVEALWTLAEGQGTLEVTDADWMHLALAYTYAGEAREVIRLDKGHEKPLYEE